MDKPNAQQQAEWNALLAFEESRVKSELQSLATRDYRLSFNVIVGYGLGILCLGFGLLFRPLLILGIVFLLATIFSMIQTTNRRIDAVIKLLDKHPSDKPTKAD